MVVRARVVRANGLEFGLLEAGTGPLALCLHGFPDSAHTWRHLLHALAEAGFHAMGPFLRGYAPTAVPPDGGHGVDALVGDAMALHQVLEGDGEAVLIGHDWGAEAAYATAAFAPDRWRRVVTLGVPAPALDPVLFGDYQQLKRFFYLFLFRAKESLRQPANLTAAISYYRDAAVDARPDKAEQAAGRPTLYLHGSADGCIGAELVGGAERLLPLGSRMTVVQGAGHFLHLEKPEEVNRHISPGSPASTVVRKFSLAGWEGVLSPAPSLVGMPKSAADEIELGGDERAELEHARPATHCRSGRFGGPGWCSTPPRVTPTGRSRSGSI